MKGLRIWLMTEIQYDQYGGATILRSFAKPAKDSPIKTGAKAKAAKLGNMKTEEAGSVDLF